MQILILEDEQGDKIDPVASPCYSLGGLGCRAAATAAVSFARTRIMGKQKLWRLGTAKTYLHAIWFLADDHFPKTLHETH